MKVRELFTVLQGGNSIQFCTDTCKRLGIEDKVYCRNTFWHKFRMTPIWDTEIEVVHTSVKPFMNSYTTVLTLTLRVEKVMTTQEIVDALSRGYDTGLLTREDINERLQNLVRGKNFQQETADRLFDLIVG